MEGMDDEGIIWHTMRKRDEEEEAKEDEEKSDEGDEGDLTPLNRSVASDSTAGQDEAHPASPLSPSSPSCASSPDAQCFYNWRDTFPQLQLLHDSVAALAREAATITSWTPWPEDHFAPGVVTDWTVFPFLHTFPALDESKSTWIQSTCQHCPKTAALLRRIPNIRTALFSRLGAGTFLTCHTGWEDLANHVLRCHVCLDIPPGDGTCGLFVDGETQYHAQGEILVFDDSKRHKAFNSHAERPRVVLIVDILRPEWVPKGKARGGHTEQLDAFVSRFR